MWHYSISLTYIKSSQKFNRAAILFYFTNEEHREFVNLPKAIELTSGRAGIQMQEAWFLLQEVLCIHFSTDITANLPMPGIDTVNTI